jgi:hypothetical protein
MYFQGLLSGLAIFLEHKSKRVELAMFSCPKALHSLYLILIDCGHDYLDFKGIELLFGSLSMGILMGLYQVESEHMSGMFSKLLKAILGEY